MKSIFSVFALVILGAGLMAQIPNASFESWVDSATYSEPTGWATANSFTNNPPLGLFAPFSTVTKSSDSHHDTLAARLETAEITVPLLGTVGIPGVVTNGTIDFDYIQQLVLGGGAGADINRLVVGGVPTTSRPAMLKGWYKYTPGGVDSFTVVVQLTRNNGTKETIGNGVWQTGATVNTYTQFTVPITYTSCAVPDTMLIVFLSSSGINGANGSTAFVDSIYLEGTNSNSAPVAGTDDVVGKQDSTISFSVSGNDSDCDVGQSLTWALLSNAANGNATMDSLGNVVYTPDTLFSGMDQFSYTVCDDATPSLCAMGTVNVDVEALPSDTSTGIYNIVDPVDVNVYPNPASDLVFMQLSKTVNNARITVYDLLGQRVKEINVEGRIARVSVEDLKEGFYFYYIQNAQDKILTRGKFNISR